MRRQVPGFQESVDAITAVLGGKLVDTITVRVVFADDGSNPIEAILGEGYVEVVTIAGGEKKTVKIWPGMRGKIKGGTEADGEGKWYSIHYIGGEWWLKDYDPLAWEQEPSPAEAVSIHTHSGEDSGGDTLNGTTLVTPIIADFTSATHSHQNAAGGGQLNATSVFSAGNVPKARQASDTVYTGDTQTLTGKTLTSPIINTGDINTPDIDGGTIDGTPIGATTQAAGTFTALTATSLTVAASTELTIVTGAVTWTQAFHRIDTEADAASDDLDTINGGAAGRIMILRAENTARTVVVTTAGNIVTPTAASVTLDETYKLLVLVYDGNLSKWIVMWGAASGGGSSYYQTIRVGGSGQTQRGKVNFIAGSNITITPGDDAGNDETELTITASVAGGSVGGGTPQGHALGFEVDYDGTNLTVAAGCCRSDDDTYTMIQTGSSTINTATTGANALDTGVIAAATWYYAYVIAKSSDATTDVLLSTSASSPTMPSGYDKKRRVGAVRTLPGSAVLWKQFTERGGGCRRGVRYMEDTTATDFRLINATNVATATSWTAVSATALVPTTAREFWGFINNGASVTPIYQWRESSHSTHIIQIFRAVNNQNAVSVFNLPLNASQAGEINTSASVVDSTTIMLHGYIDNLTPTVVGTSGA